MSMSEKHVMYSFDENPNDNFGDANVAAIRNRLENRKKNGKKRKIYTMVQVNAPCEVNITEKSREICAEILFKF